MDKKIKPIKSHLTRARHETGKDRKRKKGQNWHENTKIVYIHTAAGLI